MAAKYYDWLPWDGNQLNLFFSTRSSSKKKSTDFWLESRFNKRNSYLSWGSSKWDWISLLFWRKLRWLLFRKRINISWCKWWNWNLIWARKFKRSHTGKCKWSFDISFHHQKPTCYIIFNFKGSKEHEG